MIKRQEDLKSPETTSKGQLMKMKHMGQLWLTAEVRDLETRVKGKTALSPYLVIDADSLIQYTSMVKQLVYSRKFIVLVPSAGWLLLVFFFSFCCLSNRNCYF